jgi:hypothetical protein
MINIWALIWTPSIVPTFGNQIYLFICILQIRGKEAIEARRTNKNVISIKKIMVCSEVLKQTVFSIY